MTKEKNEVHCYIIFLIITKKNMEIIFILLNHHLYLQAPHIFMKELYNVKKYKKKTINSFPNNTSNCNNFIQKSI